MLLDTRALMTCMFSAMFILLLLLSRKSIEAELFPWMYGGEENSATLLLKTFTCTIQYVLLSLSASPSSDVSRFEGRGKRDNVELRRSRRVSKPKHLSQPPKPVVLRARQSVKALSSTLSISANQVKGKTAD